MHNKSSEVCIKTRSTPASLPFRGQVNKPTTVKWSIAMELSGVQFNLMNTSVVLVAGIGWHEALSPIKFKPVTTISMVVL